MTRCSHLESGSGALVHALGFLFLCANFGFSLCPAFPATQIKGRRSIRQRRLGTWLWFGVGTVNLAEAVVGQANQYYHPVTPCKSPVQSFSLQDQKRNFAKLRNCRLFTNMFPAGWVNILSGRMHKILVVYEHMISYKQPSCGLPLPKFRFNISSDLQSTPQSRSRRSSSTSWCGDNKKVR